MGKVIYFKRFVALVVFIYYLIYCFISLLRLQTSINFSNL